MHVGFYPKLLQSHHTIFASLLKYPTDRIWEPLKSWPTDISLTTWSPFDQRWDSPNTAACASIKNYIYRFTARVVQSFWWIGFQLGSLGYIICEETCLWPNESRRPKPSGVSFHPTTFNLINPPCLDLDHSTSSSLPSCLCHCVSSSPLQLF